MEYLINSEMLFITLVNWRFDQFIKLSEQDLLISGYDIKVKF